MRRDDVQNARDLAQRFVELSDELLATKSSSWSPERQEYVKKQWQETWLIAGKLSGTHRRASLDLTRALSYMRRRAS